MGWERLFCLWASGCCHPTWAGVILHPMSWGKQLGASEGGVSYHMVYAVKQVKNEALRLEKSSGCQDL